MAEKLTGLAASSQGSLAEVFHGATAASSDPEWVEAVMAAIERELIMGRRRQVLLVKRAGDVWFHTTRSENRAPIR